MERTIELTVTSNGEFLQKKPPLQIALITYEKGLPCLAFERPVNDIELTKENIKELIKGLTELL